MTTAIADVKASAQVSKDETEILAIIDSLHKAAAARDAAAFAAPFAPHAAVFNLAPPLAHDGIDLKEKQAWLDSWVKPVQLASRDLKITVGGDIAFCHGFLNMRGTKKGAEKGVDFWMRWTVCLERANGAWRIVHEHTSVPFYMDGPPLGAFDLQP